MNKFDINNFVIDKVYTTTFCYECPSCHNGCEFIEDESGFLTSPDVCSKGF